MRRPLSDDELLAWWRAALAGEKPVVTDQVHCGWFKRRLVKGGPEVAVRVWLEQTIDPETGELVADAILCCDVNGRPADPDDQWLWCCMSPITEAEYNYLLKLSRFARAYDPREPLANPRQAVDLFTVPPPEFKAKRRARR